MAGIEGLDFRVVPIAFTKGQDTRTQSKLVLPGTWASLINMSLSKDGTPRRRDGSRQLVAGTGSGLGNGLATRGDELLVIDGSRVSSYSPGRAALQAVPGEMGFVNVARTEVRRSNSMQDSPDCASGTSGTGTYTAYCWRELTQFGTPTGVHCTLVDEVTGAKLINDFTMRADANAFCPRVVYSQGAFFFFYISGTHLYCRVVDPSSSLTPGAESALITSAGLGDINFDACEFGSAISSSVMVVFGWADGVTSVQSICVTRAGTVPSVFAGPTNLVAEATIAAASIRGMCCASFAKIPVGNAGAFVLHGGGMSGVVINSSAWAVTTAVTLLDAFVPAAGNSHIAAVFTAIGSSCVQVFSDQQAAYGTAAISPLRTSAWSSTLIPVLAPATLINSASFSGAAAPAAHGPQGPWICGKPFSSGLWTAAGGNPTVYLPVCVMENTAFSAGSPNNNTQCTVFLLDCTTSAFVSGGTLAGVVVAKALNGAYGVPAVNSSPPNVSTPCSTPALNPGATAPSFALLANERTNLVISNGLNVSPTGLCRIEFTPNGLLPPSRLEFGPLTYFAGGQLCTYDGSRVVEHGFPLFPEGIGAAIAAGAGMTDGVHQIVAVYEWFDAQGQRHQSSPSLPVSVTAGGGNNQATVNIPSLLLSQKSAVNVVLYMTQAAGTVLNRLSLRAGHPIANSTTAAFVTVTVTESDTAIAGNEALDTQPDQAGSTLPNDAPPPCKALGVSQNRLWLLAADNELEFRYSQKLLNGFGLQFNGLFGDTTLGGLVPSDSGGTVAVAPLDEKTIILCARKLYVVFGGAPDASGNNSTLSEPEEIPSAVGCSDVLSVVRIPQGLMFKSTTGWYLLWRDLSVSYVGDGVASYDSYTIVSATVMGDRQEVRFEAQQTAGGGSGVVLVFSYLEGAWSVFQRVQTSTIVGALDALWYPPLQQYVWLSSKAADPAGFLLADVPGIWDDFIDTEFQSVVQTVGVTAWLRPAVLNGFQRVRRLYLSGTSVTTSIASTLNIAVAFDDASAGSPGAYSVGPIDLAAPMGNVVDLRHKLNRQKCKSVRFTITETPESGQIPVLGWQTMALEIGFRRGVWKLPAGQTA